MIAFLQFMISKTYFQFLIILSFVLINSSTADVLDCHMFYCVRLYFIEYIIYSYMI
jgi:hypothetical protein